MENESTLKKIFGFLRLSHEMEDPKLIQESIEKGVVFRGTNLWILIFASFVASVGLNMNSTAVIIGAMLISPLMGPINGIGYSIATYNFMLLKKSVKNYSFSIVAVLVASTLYFLLTPLHAVHSELLARTSPTIYDVFIALFGGLAGIVGISSKNKGNVIPGVAIATALMPPLCTAGYGISVGNLEFFMGAMYLFVINSVFIALSAMLVSQLLKLPRKAFLLTNQIKNTKIVVGIIILLTVVPSAYFGYTLVQKEKFKELATQFTSEISLWEGNYLLSKTINEKTNHIELVFGGELLDDASERRLKKKADEFGLDGAKLEIVHGLKTNDYERIIEGETELERLTGEVNRLKSSIVSKEHTIDSLKNIPSLGKEVMAEIKAFYPEISSCSFSETMVYSKGDSTTVARPMSIVHLHANEKISQEAKDKITSWIKVRLKKENVEVYF